MLPPIAAGRLIVHGSHDRARFAMRRLAVEIEAGEAFGSGHNATTALCLEALDWLARRRRLGRVLDLGCAPGSWLQVVERLIGDKGEAVGIDLQRVQTRFGPNVRVIEGDVFQIDPQELFGASGKPFDAVISDMAPSTTGHGDDCAVPARCATNTAYLAAPQSVQHLVHQRLSSRAVYVLVGRDRVVY